MDELYHLVTDLYIAHQQAPSGDPFESCPVPMWEGCQEWKNRHPRSRMDCGPRPACECNADEHNQKVDNVLVHILRLRGVRV